MVGFSLGSCLRIEIAGLADHGVDTRIGVLNERTGVSIEVDRFLGIEEHVLLGVNLQEEIFQSSQTNHTGHLRSLLFRHLPKTVGRHLRRSRHHCVDQIVSIHHCPFARFHLTFGKLNHTIGEMSQILAPFESKTVEEEGKHLEMIILLIPHHIYHLIDRIILIAELGGAYILSHIYGCAVGTEKKLMVESVVCKVGPYGSILLAEHYPFLQASKHKILTLKIGV